jgi:Uma2 family endonuclease
MVDLGALEGMPVELLDGLIVTVSPQGTPHARMIQALTAVFVDEVAAGRLRVRLPLAASADSEPEPDLAIAPLEASDDHPRTAELVVEVAVTLHRAARHKARIYAAAGVPAYWIVDVPGRTVEVLDSPGPEGYARMRELRGDDALPVPRASARTTVSALFAAARL